MTSSWSAPAAARWSIQAEPRFQRGGDPFSDVDGDSPIVRDLKRHMLAVARDGRVTVLILGESGTGKERVARAIYRASPRASAPFVAVNCAGLAPTLIEDELFGHVRGAFTGAVDARAGPFERADGGTVLLDEVGDLALDLQMKLLRVLQERRVHRLGGARETPFDVRIMAATNVDLARAVAQARFREDLYYRLKVYVLHVPSLVQRGAGDIRTLCASILAGLAERRRRPPPTVAPDVLDRLTRYSWPGNVRELENTLECMFVAAAGGPVLTIAHLPEEFGADGRWAAHRVRGRRCPLPSVADAAAALEAHEFKRGPTADALGVSRHQLYRLLRAGDRTVR